jgi:hypothetical protein
VIKYWEYLELLKLKPDGYLSIAKVLHYRYRIKLTQNIILYLFADTKENAKKNQYFSMFPGERKPMFFSPFVHYCLTWTF